MKADGWVLLTGSTGFLGTRVIQELMKHTRLGVYALGRRGSYGSLAERLASLWWGRPELLDHLGTRIVPVEADICQENLGLEHQMEVELLAHTDFLVHTAA